MFIPINVKLITPIIRFMASNLSPSLLLSNISFKSSCLRHTKYFYEILRLYYIYIQYIDTFFTIFKLSRERNKVYNSVQNIIKFQCVVKIFFNYHIMIEIKLSFT